MSSEDNRPVVVVERSTGLASFFWGALFGAGIALLMAPRSGEETREVLRAKGRRLRARAQDTADDLQGRLEGGYERAKARVEEGIDTARSSVADVRAGAHDAVEVGKATVHSAREELERRLSEARAARKAGSSFDPEEEDELEEDDVSDLEDDEEDTAAKDETD